MNLIPEELDLPQKTIFRKGAASDLGAVCRAFGSRGLIVHGRSFEKSGNKARILGCWPQTLAVSWHCHESGEPCLDDVTAVITQARKEDVAWISGIGGGSVLDLAKAAAGLYNAVHEPEYYQGGGRLEIPGIPFIAVPTTAGTGSEATNNSVIINKSKKVKLSIRDKSFLARAVVLDGQLLQGLPAEAMSHAAMDALVQAFESYISNKSTWLSETLALKALLLVNEHIMSAHEDQDIGALSELLLGSYLAGLGLAMSRLGVIHGIAHPLGVLYDVPHGLICAVCLPSSILINRPVIRDKYEKISSCLGMDFSQRVTELLEKLGITSPFKGQQVREKEKIITQTLASGSTAANPKKIETRDVEIIIKDIFAHS